MFHKKVINKFLNKLNVSITFDQFLKFLTDQFFIENIQNLFLLKA